MVMANEYCLYISHGDKCLKDPRVDRRTSNCLLELTYETLKPQLSDLWNWNVEE